MGKLTTEEFIKKAKEIHGDKYDYSKVEYKNLSTKVCIICPEHGEFWQSPGSHLTGRGCMKCKKPNSGMTTKEIIQKAKEVHGNKYDYSKVECKTLNTKVCIICPEHGEFWQSPVNHIYRNQNCPECSKKLNGIKRKILTNDSFIQKAKEIHGDKYDYSKVECDKVTTKVCIICPEHGEFWQAANVHLRGAGCPYCAKNVKLTLNEFIQKAKEVHGNKYDYSKVEYKDYHTKVCIICPEHGEFWEYPSNHINGRICPKCNIKLKNNVKKEKFIQKAKEIHGDKYDYSKVEYKNLSTKVCIICPEHGEFWQMPQNHLGGQGCIKCKMPNSGLVKDEFIKRAKEIHNNKYDYSKVKYIDLYTPVTIICPEHGEFEQSPRQHLKGCGCPNCNGIRKSYKFNLLKEFESEYEFKAFLENNDPNILLAILNNICESNPKFNPIKKDLEKALENSEKENPISKLEEKYSSNNIADEIEVEEEAAPVKIDLDNEEQFDEIFGKLDEADKENELTIEDAIKNTEKEIKIVAKVENLIAPELRKKIMKKLLNDKLRQWMELNS